MRELLSLRGFRLILLVVVLGLIGLFLLNRYGPAARQGKNMALAQGYVDVKMEEIAGREEFAQVSIVVSPAANGSVLVHGVVRDEASENRLRELVKSDPPPTAVRWRIMVEAAMAKELEAGEAAPAQ